MNERRHQAQIEAVTPDNADELTLAEICRVLEVRAEVITEWVDEGVVRPSGARLTEWRFSGRELERARRARRLQRDLELDSRSLPLVLDLLTELQRLRRRLRLFEQRYFE